MSCCKSGNSLLTFRNHRKTSTFTPQCKHMEHRVHISYSPYFFFLRKKGILYGHNYVYALSQANHSSLSWPSIIYFFFSPMLPFFYIFEVRLFYISHFELERSVKLSDNGTGVFTVISITVLNRLAWLSPIKYCT